ncbi:2-phospho-L-lactate transferase [Pseudomonas saliphila]|uniref:2-phospho-L-lactate transferase n=1 Tax=Pseudomonas saliphila TaxID=2586906 RepID=UPI001238C6F2|nr:2-phospho-L-lactate transferase [Pseudomonas saliphila]
MNGGRILALSGGVGGAKLADGLMHACPGGRLTLVVNTGDDFNHLGLHISPDIDTALYTLSGFSNPQTGWGRRDETWSFMQALEQLGGDTWFRLGDADLALHVERTHRLAAGASLSEITAEFGTRLGISAQILPMSDDPVRTRVSTDMGELDFQHYFVREQCRPQVRRIEFSGAETARPAPGVVRALQNGDLDAIILCPSNPYLSIAPILAVTGMRALLRAAGVPVIAVSPLVGGQAVKGPTTKIMNELGLSVSALQIVQDYAGLIDGFVLDSRDAQLRDQIDLPVAIVDTLMHSPLDRQRVAQQTLAFATTLRA